jgi:hypothetical protein
MLVEEKLSIGIQYCADHHFASPARAGGLPQKFPVRGNAIDAQGGLGPVKVILFIVKREDVPQYLSIVNQFQPRAFFSVQNVRLVHERIFPLRRFQDIRGYLGSIRLPHKGR